MLFGSCENAIKEGYEIRKDGFKHCGYCGSLEPIELAKLIREGKATMSGSDWKYGWPHKFYVDIKNPNADKQAIVGHKCYTDDKGRHEEPIYGYEGDFHCKFYSNHLKLLDDKTFKEVAPVISQACGITWDKKDGKLYYKAPYSNYQK